MSDLSRADIERLARIENKVDTILERTAEDRLDFRGRIRALERWRWGTGAALIGAVLAFIPALAPLSGVGGG